MQEDRREDLQNKVLDVHRLVAHVQMCVLDVLRVRWNLVFIGVERNCGSLFIGVVIAFANNSWLIDNNREVIDKS